MSGDNLLDEQLIKLYSKEITETKIKFVHHYLKFMYQSNSVIDLDRNQQQL